MKVDKIFGITVGLLGFIYSLTKIPSEKITFPIILGFVVFGLLIFIIIKLFKSGEPVAGCLLLAFVFFIICILLFAPV